LDIIIINILKSPRSPTENNNNKRNFGAEHIWLTFVILANQEAEIRRVMV
jgi:hypothetical protein